MPPRTADAPNTKFNQKKREEYLAALREGSLKFEAAKRVGIGYRTVQRRRADDEDFKRDERLAEAERDEEIEKVLRDLALQGDISALKMWLAAHNRSYASRSTVEVDATPAAVEVSKAVALGKIADLQRELAERHERLALDDPDIIDVDPV